MGQRPISGLQRQWLAREVSVWQQAGIVTPDAAQQILGSYETHSEAGQRKQSLAIYALVSIAALFVALAAFLVIGYNWQALHWVAKLAIVFAVILATQCTAAYLRFRTRHQTFAEILFFLGCLFYGAGIFLVAQIFNLNAHFPSAFWWWALGVLPFALCLDTVLLHLLFAALLAIWAGSEVIGFTSLGPWLFSRWLPNGAYLLLPMAVLGLAWAYRKPSTLTVSIYLALLTWWVILQLVAWDLQWQWMYLVGMMGAAMWILAENHRPHSALAIPYRMYGTLLICDSLIPPSFAEFHKDLQATRSSPNYHFHSAQVFAELTLFIMVAAVLMASVLLLQPLGDSPRANPFSRLIEVARRQWVPLGILFVNCLMAALTFGDGYSLVLVTVLANVSMIVFAIFLIRAGLQRDHGFLFAAGVGYLLLWSIMRYIDLFGDMGGMLGAALMFFLCGALLFGLALLWGRRKEINYGKLA